MMSPVAQTSTSGRGLAQPAPALQSGAQVHPVGVCHNGLCKLWHRTGIAVPCDLDVFKVGQRWY